MESRCSWVAVLALAGCAKGTLDDGTSFGVTVSTTQPGSGGEQGDSEESSSAGATSSGGSEGQSASADSEATTDPVTASADSSGGMMEESSSDPTNAVTTNGMTSNAESSSDDGMPPPPDSGEWDACDLADCSVGNDCVSVTGLRAYVPFCSPQCMTDADCPPPATGDAIATCGLTLDGAAAPTNCALLCSYDNVPQGTCPDGMTCADVPGLMTQASLCMWP